MFDFTNFTRTATAAVGPAASASQGHTYAAAQPQLSVQVQQA